MAFIKLELLYEDVAEQLGPVLEPEDRIAAGDIGALGFYSGARILDTVGLISPRSLPYYPLPSSYYAINYAIAPELIMQENPEYLVMLEVYGRNGLLKNPQFIERYQLLQQIPTDIYGSQGMLVFQFIGQP
jgi:hypothetical protein